MYGIADKLAGAENILIAMGYQRPPTNQDSQELRIEGEVDLIHVAKTAADLVILQCDLVLLKGNAKGIASDHPELRVRISDILDARGMKDQTYTDTYEEAIHRATMRQHVSKGVKYPPRMVSVGYSIAEECRFDERQCVRRCRSSEDVLDQTVPGQDGYLGDIPEYSDLDQHRSAPCKQNSEGNLLDRSGRKFSVPRTTSMPEENSWDRGFKSNKSGAAGTPDSRKESWDIPVTSPTSLENSMAISYSQSIPRPNLDDLPEPVFDNEAGFVAAGDFPPPLRHVSSSDMSCEGNRVNLYVNSSSADDDPLNRLLFSPDENHKPRFHGSSESERVAADGPDSNDPAITNISKVMLNSKQTVGLKHASSQVVEVSRQNLTYRASDSRQELFPDSGDFDSKVSIGSEGKKSLSDSIGEKRKRHSPYTSLDNDDALQERISHTSITTGEGDTENHNGKVNYASPEKPVAGSGETVNVESEQRPRSHHICEKSKGDYNQKEEDASPKEKGKREKAKSNPAGASSGDSSNLKLNDDQWVCDYCTYINPKGSITCEVCSIPRKTS